MFGIGVVFCKPEQLSLTLASSSPDVVTFGRMFGCIVYSDELVPINGKVILISSNCPPLRRSEIEDYAMLAKVGVHHYNGNNVDLGTACGKYFCVSFLSIVNPAFNIAQEESRAYDVAACRIRGDRAEVNFPKGLIPSISNKRETKARNELHHASQHLGAISDSAFSRQRILVGTATTLLTTWGMIILVMCEFHGKEASDVHQSVRVNKHLCCREQHIPVLQLRSGQ
ncbi:hypothetical protein DY000_02062972 [Brassica cretica]|uniref:Ribosomal protein eL8/eL30/eS12/Gadd45 domain-containing protein n=1 Tax=Brassica cretica TaxID=69181 RepID=A0ABQ7AWI1_BRACR|nr:hypothetical protein DY000_02062972 [Brassica cretica]